MKTAWAGMLDPHGFGALLQADAGVRLLTSRRAAGVLAGVQPRRTDGEDKLPKYQQRRQNSKAVGKHALRATEKFRVPGPTSAENCAQSLRQVNQSTGSNAKLVCQTVCLRLQRSEFVDPAIENRHNATFPQKRLCRNASQSYDFIDRGIGFGRGSASERPDELVPANSIWDITSPRLSLIPAFSQRMRHVEVCSDKSKRCDVFPDATSTVTSAEPKSASIIRSS